MAVSEKYRRAVAEALVFHQIVGSIDDVTAANLKSLVMDFQASVGILVDGDVGPVTLWELQYPMLPAEADKYELVSVPADVVDGFDGYDHFRLRADAAAAYTLLRDEVVANGGRITSSGGLRALSEVPNAHRSAKSLHYTGLALDVAVSSGSFEPQTDPFVIVRTGQSSPYFEVYYATVGGTVRDLTAVKHSGLWKRVTVRSENVSRSLDSFTGAAAVHGFAPIRPRSGYTQLRKYMSAEWWHFQYEEALVPQFSQFGIELLKLEGYTRERILAENPALWDYKNAIFGRDWN